ncbi:hypothetical protein [Saccharothrix variisporea]|uniref:Uncharacterized protein n=1 Tax=Saccharothrix variisporea TaxID=543527 RepID=A0A495X5W9_9PSEU|nr:hypothetical protein [Saccharothrix variisporea]RKT69372.1 hypothetical protein DFJ66_2592 [Saccharothrix variisporea]
MWAIRSRAVKYICTVVGQLKKAWFITEHGTLRVTTRPECLA